MKVILLMVSSVNGKITRGFESDVTAWTSPEDQKLFSDMRHLFDAIIMGSHTYENNNNRIDLTITTPRYVLTKQPEVFQRNSIPGLLEFTKETPFELLKRLSALQMNSILIVGGSEITSSFLKAGLIDEINLTIEPKLFGNGKNLLSEIDFSVDLELLESVRLNSSGTLHLKYKVLKKV